MQQKKRQHKQTVTTPAGSVTITTLSRTDGATTMSRMNLS